MQPSMMEVENPNRVFKTAIASGHEIFVHFRWNFAMELNMRHQTAIAVSLAASLLSPHVLLAQTASLDTSFAGASGIRLVSTLSEVGVACEQPGVLAITGRSIATPSNQTYLRLGRDGTFVFPFANTTISGSQVGSLVQPRGLCVSDRLILARTIQGVGTDQNILVVQLNASNGSLISETLLDADLSFPGVITDTEILTGLNATPAGNALVTLLTNGIAGGTRSMLVRILPSGTPSAGNYPSLVGTGLSEHGSFAPWGASVGPDGNVWMTGEGNSTSFSQSRLVQTFVSPTSLAITSVLPAIAPPPPPAVSKPTIGRASINLPRGNLSAGLSIEAELNGSTLRRPFVNGNYIDRVSLLTLPQPSDGSGPLTISGSSVRLIDLGNGDAMYVAATGAYQQAAGGAGWYFAKIKINEFGQPLLDTTFGNAGVYVVNFPAVPGCGGPNTTLSSIMGATIFQEQLVIYGRHNVDCSGEQGFLAMLNGRIGLFKNGFED
jgi:hypothetical protein